MNCTDIPKLLIVECPGVMSLSPKELTTNIPSNASPIDAFYGESYGHHDWFATREDALQALQLLQAAVRIGIKLNKRNPLKGLLDLEKTI